MATVVKENFSKRTFSRTSSTITVRRVFNVSFDEGDCTSTQEPYYASYATGGGVTVPSYGEEHPDLAYVYVDEKDVVSVGPHIFEVVVIYHNAILLKNSQAVSEDPTQADPEISYFTISSSEKVDKDINGDAISNSAGETFDPPINRDYTDIGMRITRYQNSYDPLTSSDYYDTINSEEFYNFAVGTVMFKGLSADEIYLGTQKYWKIVSEFHIRKDGWKRKILDEGFRVSSGSNILPAGNDAKAIKDGDDNTISEPALLNGSGGILASGADAVFREFDIYESKNFSSLA